MTLSTATRKRLSPLRLLSARYAMEDLTRDQYLAERRRLLSELEREIRAPAAQSKSGPVARPEETPGHGNHWVLVLIVTVILAALAILLLR